MARTRIEIHSAGIKDLLRDPGVRRDLTARAENVLSAAKASAPVDTGEYRDSLHVIEDTTDRVSVRVGSNDPKGLIVEAKTGNLARALDAAG